MVVICVLVLAAERAACTGSSWTNGPPPLAVGGVKVPVVVEGRRRRQKLHARAEYLGTEYY